MRLTDLTPYWMKFVSNDEYRIVDSLAEADGLMLLCPVCFEKNGSNVGTHSVMCWFRNRVPDSTPPNPGRWTPSGHDFRDLTFIEGFPKMATSVKIEGGCNAHFFIENGGIRMA